MRFAFAFNSALWVGAGLVLLLAGNTVAAPITNGTLFMDPDIILPTDPSTFAGVTFTGTGHRQMFDRRLNAYADFNAFLFKVTFADGSVLEIQVNPEFGNAANAQIQAEKYGIVIGRLPAVLLRDLDTVCIHQGVAPFGGGNRNILIHTGQADLYTADGLLEEALLHEGSHVSLDPYHAASTGWLAAQAADADFISTYARDFPNREDVAESFVAWFAVRYRAARISSSLASSILVTIPNRLTYFDDYVRVYNRKVSNDFNRDRKADILWKHTNGSVSEWLMTGVAAGSATGLIGPGTGWSAHRTGDFNGDGKTDILWQRTDGTVVIWLMDGLNATATGTLIGAATGWSVSQVGDFNGDSKTDILWQHTDGSVGLWLMNGLSATGGRGLLSGGTGWSASHVGDFNGDSKADILWRHTDGGAALWLMNGLDTVGSTGLIGAGTGWSVSHVGYFNGDGKSDILWKHTGGNVGMWLMNGLTPIGVGGVISGSTGWSVSQLGDFNGDSKADILWRHTNGGVEVWLMNGLNPTGQCALTGAGAGWNPADTADFNGDGKTDILFQHTDGSAVIWLMDGSNSTGVGSLLGAGTGWSPAP